MKKDYSNKNADAWFRQITEEAADFPFSFFYGGKKYIGFASADIIKLTENTSQSSEKTEYKAVYGFADGMQVSVLAVHYKAYGVSEWTLRFENKGAADSDIIEQPASILRFAGSVPVLRGILGDHDNSYSPYSYDLTDIPVHFRSDSGRATHGNFPYFNLEYADAGCMLAIGWAGTWTADFSYNRGETVCTLSSVNGLHTYLHPGEKLRTALFVKAPYTVRNESYAVNFWRSWFVEYNLPRADAQGNALQPFSTCSLASDTGLPNSDGSISERYYTWRPSLEKMIKEGVKTDFRWLDAGWYIAPDGTSPEVDWWGTVGTWQPDPVKWPGGTLRESTDFARANGMKTLMWFEPERVTDPHSLAEKYGYNTDWAIVREGKREISNNIGIPGCLEWTRKRVCDTLRENGIEMYREDNNSDPGELWRYLDSREGKNRTGMTECRFVTAHYKLWDDIIACTLSYGGCGYVDSCASGGGRNDIESLRRGIPMLRSDADRTSASLRLSMTTSFNKWIPFCGANTKEKARQLDAKGRSDVYTWRASYLPALNVDSQFVQDPGQDFDMLRFGLCEWKSVSPYLLKDFYVHTPWHSEHDRNGFTAYSFFDGDAGEGVLLVFRMENCLYENIMLRLQYAAKEAAYTLTDEDSGEKIQVSGETLSNGYTFTLSEPRTAKLIKIKRI